MAKTPAKKAEAAAPGDKPDPKASETGSDAGPGAPIVAKDELGEIVCDTVPWIVGGKTAVSRIKVKTLRFAGSVRCLKEAGRAVGESFNIEWHRARRRAQTVALDDKGNPVDLTDIDMLSMPRIYASKLQSLLFAAVEPEGKVLSLGDAIGKPAHIVLGTPLKGKDGSGASVVVEELEFQASTLADIEGVMAESMQPAQALAFIKSCARPVGLDMPLVQLPDWMIEQITITDGTLVMEKLLPSFFPDGA